jgi:hypothetical protein
LKEAWTGLTGWTGFGSVCLKEAWTGLTGWTGFGSVCLEALDRINRIYLAYFVALKT